MTLRLNEKQDSDLSLIAEYEGLSKQQVMIKALEAYVAEREHKAQFQKAFNHLMEKHAGLLDALSKT